MIKKWFKKTSSRIYMDTAAGTCIDKEVEKSMNKVVSIFANPSSIHKEGLEARKLLDQSRNKIADILECQTDEIIFTSGGTESNNLAILGTVKQFKENYGKPGTILVSPIEHNSVIKPLLSLKREGWNIVELEVNKKGELDLDDLKNKLETYEDIALISIGYVNNELGIIAPISQIAKIVKKYKKNNYPYFHSDYCQVGRFLSMSMRASSPDLVSFNGYKIYGPKGVGVLYKKRSIDIKPLIKGGGQEFGLRSGTENVKGAVGLARALEICQNRLEKDNKHLTKYRDLLRQEILNNIEGVTENGISDHKVSNNLNLTFKGVDSELLVLELDNDGFAVSTGSACSSNTENTNYVLKALYGENFPSESSVRFSLDRDIKDRDIKKLAISLKEIIKRQKQEVV